MTKSNVAKANHESIQADVASELFDEALRLKNTVARLERENEHLKLDLARALVGEPVSDDKGFWHSFARAMADELQVVDKLLNHQDTLECFDYAVVVQQTVRHTHNRLLVATGRGDELERLYSIDLPRSLGRSPRANPTLAESPASGTHSIPGMSDEEALTH